MKESYVCPMHFAGSLFSGKKAEVEDTEEGFFENPGNRTGGKRVTYKSATYPAVNIFESTENLYLTAELPGYSSDDVDIMLEKNYLKLFGKRETDAGKGSFLRVERQSGFFSRQIRIPFLINAEIVKAHMEKGVLTITIPKPGAGNLKKITIQSD